MTKLKLSIGGKNEQFSLEVPSFGAWHKVKVVQRRADVNADGESEGVVIIISVNGKNANFPTGSINNPFPPDFHNLCFYMSDPFNPVAKNVQIRNIALLDNAGTKD